MTAQPLRALYVGIDVGTTHTKVVAVDEAGRPVAAARGRTPRSRDAWGEVHEARPLVSTVNRLVRQSVASVPGGRLAAVATASVAEEGFFLDAGGRVLAPSPLWSERRTSPSQAAWRARHDLAAAYARTGVDADAIRTWFRWLWLFDQDPALPARAWRWLSVSEYLAWRLCGEIALSDSQASRTHLWSLVDRRWCIDWLEEAGLGANLLGPVRPAGTRLGPLAAGVLTGVPRLASAQVVLGGHDHVVGGWAAGGGAPGSVLVSLGTAESLWAPLPAPAPDDRARRFGIEFGRADAIVGAFAMAAQASGADVAAWARVLRRPVDRFAALAAGAPAGAAGARYHPPAWREGARASLVGLPPGPASAVVARAVMEGWALGAGAALRELERLAGGRLGPVRAIGGASANELVLLLRASVFGRPIEVLELPEAVAFGAALLARSGAAGATRVLAPPRPTVRARIDPVPAWQDLYRAFTSDAPV